MHLRSTKWLAGAILLLVPYSHQAFAVQKEAAKVHSDVVQKSGPLAELLIDAKRKIGDSQYTQAEALLRKARSQLNDPQFRVIWNVLSAELMDAKGSWSESAFFGSAALREHFSLVKNQDSRGFSLQWNLSIRDVVMLTVENFTRAGLPLSAYQEFERAQSELQRAMLSSDEEVILKKLADELRRMEREKEAAELEKIIFKNYPFISSALRAGLNKETLCKLDNLYADTLDKKARASLLLQRLGARDDIKNYAFSLVGLSPVLKLAETPPDQLSAQTRSEMLDLVEWLHAAREYNLAMSITEKLMASVKFEPPFMRDRLLLLHARNLNGVHRPVEAAQLYRGLMRDYPNLEAGKTARARYVMSLHFAQKYDDVERQASLLTGAMRPRDVAWRAFWARFLGKQYGRVLSSSQNALGREQRARVQYWRARALEGEGRKLEAKEAFRRIPMDEGALQYSLFARWQLETRRSAGTQSPRGTVSLAAKKLNGLEPDDAAVFSTVPPFSAQWAVHHNLIENGFGGLMRGVLRQRLQSTSGAAGTELGALLVEAGDANAAVQFASSQRKIVGRVPVGRDKEWKPFLAKNAATMRLLYPLAYRNWIQESADNYKISPWLILSIMRAESLFQPQIVSNVGARGLMQIMPLSGARIAELNGYPDFEPAHLDRPEVSISFGAWYLSRLMNYYSGNLPLAIAAYNAGPVAIDRWLKKNSDMSLDAFLEDIPFDQTRKYVATVLTNMEIYSRLYSQGAKGIEIDMHATLPTPKNNMEIF
jgi:soluble lytic murein transglycosylase-like protein